MCNAEIPIRHLKSKLGTGKILRLQSMLRNNATKNKRGDVLPHLNPRGNTFISQTPVSNVCEASTERSHHHEKHVSRDTARYDHSPENRDSLQCFVTGGCISSHSHMSSPEPSRAEALWKVMQVNRRVGGLSRTMWTLSIICACVYFGVFMRICCLCLRVCLLLNLAVVSVNRSVESVRAVLLCQLLRSPRTRRLLGSLGMQTAAMPSHNSSAKPWTSQEEVWYHESRMSPVIRPRWTSSRQLPYPKPKF